MNCLGQPASARAPRQYLTPTAHVPQHQSAAAALLPPCCSASKPAVDKTQPDWTGDALLSRGVNWMINTRPIFEVMKLGAKAAMKSTTQAAGLDWDGHVAGMAQRQELALLCEEFSRQPPGTSYPDYYTVPFHAYDEGNLNWLAAYEVEPASYAMALRTFKGEGLTASEAMERLRGNINEQMQAYLARHGLTPPATLLDIGCSTGISSRWYQVAFPDAQVTGLDLSPYFLAVAEAEERRLDAATPPGQRRIKFVRGLAEATGFPSGAWDMVVFSFIAHECPQSALDAFVAEARRIIAPGGVVVFVDNNPRSKTIQNLPPVLFTLMKSTEPWSDEYYSYDLEGALRASGFADVVTTEADHRHRTVFGRVPTP